MDNLNIPIYRAKKIDGIPTGNLIQSEDPNILTPELRYEYIEGFYKYDARLKKHSISYQRTRKRGTLTWCVVEIDPSTLAISFDGGKTWLSLKDIDSCIGHAFVLDCKDDNFKHSRNQPKNKDDIWSINIFKVTGIYND